MRLECRDLSFRYSDKQPFILEHFSMSVSEGERVARGQAVATGYRDESAQARQAEL